MENMSIYNVLLRLMSKSAIMFCIIAANVVLEFELPLIEKAYAQTLYGYRTNRGAITYTSRRPSGTSFWKVKSRKPVVSSQSKVYVSRGGGRLRAVPSRFDATIKRISERHSVEPALVKAVIHAESAFKPSARSSKGAVGLMQLMPATAKRFGVRNRKSPDESIQGGVRYLAWLSKFFGGNVTKMLAGYNAGENAVVRYNGIPPYRETQGYVRKVLTLRRMYYCDLSGRRSC